MNHAVDDFRTSGLNVKSVTRGSRWLGALLGLAVFLGCAGTPEKRDLLNAARSCARDHGIDLRDFKVSSKNITDARDSYVITFTRKEYFFRSVGAYFSVAINKQTKECRFIPGR